MTHESRLIELHEAPPSDEVTSAMPIHMKRRTRVGALILGVFAAMGADTMPAKPAPEVASPAPAATAHYARPACNPSTSTRILGLDAATVRAFDTPGVPSDAEQRIIDEIIAWDQRYTRPELDISYIYDAASTTEYQGELGLNNLLRNVDAAVQSRGMEPMPGALEKLPGGGEGANFILHSGQQRC